jgi:hypothetical protein
MRFKLLLDWIRRSFFCPKKLTAEGQEGVYSIWKRDPI